MRWVVAWSALVAACSGGAQKAQPARAPAPTARGQAHLTTGHGVSRARTTDAVIMERLHQLANTLPAGATAERVALGDLAYPKDQGENAGMAGHALLLVTSVTRNADELPLAAVKVQTAAGERRLQSVARRDGKVTDPEVARAFGEQRMDELFYLPLALTRERSTLLVDFAKNRQNFELLSFPPPPESDGFPAGLRVLDPGEPSIEATIELADREFGWRDPE